MNSGMRKIFAQRGNKEYISKFPEVYPNQQRLEEGQRAQRPKHFDDNEDEDIILNVYNYLIFYWSCVNVWPWYTLVFL